MCMGIHGEAEVEMAKGVKRRSSRWQIQSALPPIVSRPKSWGRNPVEINFGRGARGPGGGSNVDEASWDMHVLRGLK